MGIGKKKERKNPHLTSSITASSREEGRRKR